MKGEDFNVKIEPFLFPGHDCYRYIFFFLRGQFLQKSIKVDFLSIMINERCLNCVIIKELREPWLPEWSRWSNIHSAEIQMRERSKILCLEKNKKRKSNNVKQKCDLDLIVFSIWIFPDKCTVFANCNLYIIMQNLFISDSFGGIIKIPFCVTKIDSLISQPRSADWLQRGTFEDKAHEIHTKGNLNQDTVTVT